MALRPYQKEAARFAVQVPNPYLALEVGLGKTVVSLALIQYLKMNTLVVAPKAVCLYTWPEEVETWARHLRLATILGTREQRRAAAEAEAEIHVINYENLVWLIQNCPWKWPLVIFDEASKMGGNSSRVKHFLKIRDRVEKVIMLSGTPIGGKPEKIFWQYKCKDSDHSPLGETVSHYRLEYCEGKGYPRRYYIFRKDKIRALSEKLRPTMLVMRTRDYVKQLPRMIQSVVPFELSEAGRDQYEEMLEHMILELDDLDTVIAKTAATKSSKLRQIVSGFVYNQEGKAKFLGKDKLEAYHRLIEEIGEDEQIMTFYFYREEAKLLEGEPLNNHTKTLWNSGRLKRLVLHPASAGHGLNLQHSSARHIIFFSTPWSSEEFVQSIGRILRPGNQAETVTVHHLMARGTIEGRVLRDLKRKVNEELDIMGVKR